MIIQQVAFQYKSFRLWTYQILRYVKFDVFTKCQYYIIKSIKGKGWRISYQFSGISLPLTAIYEENSIT